MSTARSRVGEAETVIRSNVDDLSLGLGRADGGGGADDDLDARMVDSLAEIAQHVEALASSAEESSSSILEMTATNDEVAENMANLASSVRETVSSIEEMAYSIKEVARNVDALSLTAEETSSSMNQMGRVHRPGPVERQRNRATLRGGRRRTAETGRGFNRQDHPTRSTGSSPSSRAGETVSVDLQSQRTASRPSATS